MHCSFCLWTFFWLQVSGNSHIDWLNQKRNPWNHGICRNIITFPPSVWLVLASYKLVWFIFLLKKQKTTNPKTKQARNLCTYCLHHLQGRLSSCWLQTSQRERFLLTVSTSPILSSSHASQAYNLLWKGNCCGQGSNVISISKSNGSPTVLSSVDFSRILDRVDHSLLLEALSFLVYHSGFSSETKPTWHIHAWVPGQSGLSWLFSDLLNLLGWVSSFPVTSWHWPAWELDPWSLSLPLHSFPWWSHPVLWLDMPSMPSALSNLHLQPKCQSLFPTVHSACLIDL